MPTGTKINTSEEDIAQILFNISFIMCDIQSKINIYGKKQGNESHGKEKNVKINLDMAQLLNFAETFKQLLCASSDLKEMLSMSKAKGISAERWKV